MSRTYAVPADVPNAARSGYPTFAKDPTAVLDYTFDWGAWLAGDTIASATWQIVKQPTSLTDSSTLTRGTSSTTATTAAAFVSAGTTGINYLLECSITTAGGRTAIRAVLISVTSLPQ